MSHLTQDDLDLGLDFKNTRFLDELIFEDKFSFTEPETTKTIAGTFPYLEKLQHKVITKGKWKLTIQNPIGDVPFETIRDSVMTYSERDGAKIKRYEIIDYIFFPERNEAEIIINVLDNPIPLFVIWGAVALAVMITGAIATNSVLVDITKIVDDIGTSPLVIGVLLIFLIPVLITGGKFIKKGK